MTKRGTPSADAERISAEPQDERDVRQALIDAAIQLFYERGYAATGVKDIVDQARCTKGALYHYFRSKEDLLAEIYNDFMKDLAARGRAIRDEHQPAPIAIGLIVEALMVEVRQRRAQFTVAFLETRIDLDRYPEARAAGEEWRLIVSEIIADGRSNDDFEPTIDPGVALWALLGMCIWSAFQWRPANSDLELANVSNMLAKLVMHGLVDSG